MPLPPGAYIAEEVAPWIDASGKIVPATGGAAVGQPPSWRLHHGWGVEAAAAAAAAAVVVELLRVERSCMTYSPRPRRPRRNPLSCSRGENTRSPRSRITRTDPPTRTHASSKRRQRLTRPRCLRATRMPSRCLSTPAQRHGLDEGKLPLISRSTKTGWVEVTRHGGWVPDKTTTSIYRTATGTTMVIQDTRAAGRAHLANHCLPGRKAAWTLRRRSTFDPAPSLTDWLRGLFKVPAGLPELPLGSGGGMMRPY